MERKKKYAREPLLYIHQPQIQKPQAKMQHHYTTPPKKVFPAPVDPVKTTKEALSDMPLKKKAERKKVSVTPIVPASVPTDVPVEKTGEKEASINEHDNEKAVKFEDRSLEEKITYFLRGNDHVPKMRCEIKTADRTYRGKVVDFKDNMVYMQVARRTAITPIPFDHIKQVRMLGF